MTAAFQSQKLTFSANPLTMPAPNSSLLPTKALVTPRRFDIAVKWRFFSYLIRGGDTGAVEAYRWHLEKRSGARMAAGLATDAWKMTLDDYVASAASLCRSMAYRGFDPTCAIPIDPDGELLNGSHRVACALALGIESVPVRRERRLAWAPSWGLQFFIDHGMGEEDLSRLKADWETLTK